MGTCGKIIRKICGHRWVWRVSGYLPWTVLFGLAKTSYLSCPSLSQYGFKAVCLLRHRSPSLDTALLYALAPGKCCHCDLLLSILYPHLSRRLVGSRAGYLLRWLSLRFASHFSSVSLIVGLLLCGLAFTTSVEEHLRRICSVCILVNGKVSRFDTGRRLPSRDVSCSLWFSFMSMPMKLLGHCCSCPVVFMQNTKYFYTYCPNRNLTATIIMIRAASHHIVSHLFHCDPSASNFSLPSFLALLFGLHWTYDMAVVFLFIFASLPKQHPKKQLAFSNL